MTILTTTRRNFISTATVAAVASPALIRPAEAKRPADSSFSYEVQRTEDEWRSLLSEKEFDVLRGGGTEPRFSSDLATEERDGVYTCKGCGLELYKSEWKVIYPFGWAFWFHSEENAVLTGLDVIPAEMSEMADEMEMDMVMAEVHCRRCGSHLGHLVSIQGKPTHCINGSALIFTPTTA